LDAVLDHEVAGHQAAGRGGDGAEGEGLAFQVLQRLHVRVGGDELAGELLILLALHQGNRIAGLQAGLHEGETAQPGQVETIGGQGFDHCGIVGNRSELHRHAQLLFEVFAQRLELADQFGRGFIGNGGHPQRFGSV